MAYRDYYILIDGQPVPVDDMMTYIVWSAAHAEEHILRKAQIGTTEVSTVFLGFDHRWGHGQPELFETMIFGGPLDGHQWRYATREQAILHHKEVVEKVQAADVMKPG